MGRSDVGITGGASGANAGAGLGPARYFGAWVDLVRCRKTAFLVAGSVDEAHARNRICNAGQVESCGGRIEPGVGETLPEKYS